MIGKLLSLDEVSRTHPAPKRVGHGWSGVCFQCFQCNESGDVILHGPKRQLSPLCDLSNGGVGMLPDVPSTAMRAAFAPRTLMARSTSGGSNGSAYQGITSHCRRGPLCRHRVAH